MRGNPPWPERRPASLHRAAPPPCSGNQQRALFSLRVHDLWWHFHTLTSLLRFLLGLDSSVCRRRCLPAPASHTLHPLYSFSASLSPAPARYLGGFLCTL